MREAFARVFGSAQGVRVFRGPGRVNLIGEHTDYNLGFVLPMALDLACFTAVAPNGGDKLRVYSEDMQQSREWTVKDLESLEPAHDWGDYVAGVAQQLVRAGYPVAPVNLLIRSTVPVGSGLSSSAALETSTALALLGDRRMEPLELVRLCRRAENEFVGMPCGIMDQYISVFGREGAAVKIDCRSLEHEVVQLPPDVAIIAVNTMVKHELGQSAYRDRVRECAEAVEVIRGIRPGVESLRDVDVATFEIAAEQIPPVPRKRARHVVTEDARVEAFMAASKRGDLETMGALFVASHRSLQNDYEVSCEELDFLVDTALGLPGVLGARMTGGGFGGCTVNLVRPQNAEEFSEKITAAYKERFGITPAVYRCKPSAGAGEIC
ncbi:MAG TPA: galactokinase [Bryobacteraceae bacterium]|nr:galactokinase [Bryobacteraceae bacterium]HPQ17205.1 galactokinase [Bryobacteraceae bacterium]HPU72608.1 galactokinase [Bryobacteraceae bacterium]